MPQLSMERRMVSLEERSSYIRETLVRIEEKVDNLCEQQDKYVTKEEFENRMGNVDKSIGNNDDDIKATSKLVSMLFGGLALAAVIWQVVLKLYIVK